jgi:hypothetical protein
VLTPPGDDHLARVARSCRFDIAFYEYFYPISEGEMNINVSQSSLIFCQLVAVYFVQSDPNCCFWLVAGRPCSGTPFPVPSRLLLLCCWCPRSSLLHHLHPRTSPQPGDRESVVVVVGRRLAPGQLPGLCLHLRMTPKMRCRCRHAWSSESGNRPYDFLTRMFAMICRIFAESFLPTFKCNFIFRQNWQENTARCCYQL